MCPEKDEKVSAAFRIAKMHHYEKYIKKINVRFITAASKRNSKLRTYRKNEKKKKEKKKLEEYQPYGYFM